jgi:hypothetical protein
MPHRPDEQAIGTVPERMIREQLTRMQASPLFLRAEHVGKLLRFIVDQTLSGNAANLREKEIACQLYGKADFKPETDSIVRSAARRLRFALREYYSEPLDHQVLISLPRGSYVPVFHLCDSSESAAAKEHISKERELVKRDALRLRKDSAAISGKQARVIVAQNDFYCAEWNESGKGIEHDYQVEAHEDTIVVIDQATGLMWEKGDADDPSFSRAEEYISQLNTKRVAACGDWRLPTLEEAMSLLTTQEDGWTIELVSGEEGIRDVRVVHLDQVFDRGYYVIWTSDPYADDPTYVWVVFFIDGKCGIQRKYVGACVKAVRSLGPETGAQPSKAGAT